MESHSLPNVVSLVWGLEAALQEIMNGWAWRRLLLLRGDASLSTSGLAVCMAGRTASSQRLFNDVDHELFDSDGVPRLGGTVGHEVGSTRPHHGAGV
jgi:hypothetical protein